MREDIDSLIHELESDRIERKESYSDRDKICEAICAFSNDLPNWRKPGYVFIGVKDNGEIIGVDNPERLLEEIGDLRSNGNIHPFPMIEVFKHQKSEKDIIAIQVFPSLHPPVRYKGRTCIRVGARRAYATPEEEIRLQEKRRRSILPADLSEVQGAPLDDLDLSLFNDYKHSAIAPEVIVENNRTIEEQLSSLRLYSLESSCPTMLGILVIGKDPRAYIPCAYIQFVRYHGTELTDEILDQKEIDGPLAPLLSELDHIFKINISTSSIIDDHMTEQKRPDYPLIALQQLGRNAIMHRTYEGTNTPIRIYWFSDRIEIHSPGGPFGIVNQDNFAKSGITDYRNPNLADAMKTLGYVQRFGIGIITAKKSLSENGNPELKFEMSETLIAAIVRK